MAHVETLQQWVERSKRTDDVVTPTPFAALAAALDRDAARPPPGTPLPAPWHWLYFLPLYRRCDVGPDGHAERGGFLPPVPLPRPMWAGTELTSSAATSATQSRAFRPSKTLPIRRSAADRSCSCACATVATRPATDRS